MARIPMYETSMGIMSISIPDHLKKWLLTRPEGASEWIRSQIEQNVKMETDLGGSEEVAKAKIESGKRELEAIAEKKAKDAEIARSVEVEAQKKAEFVQTRAELEDLKVLWREEYNDAYRKLRVEFPTFNPLHVHADAKILLDSTKELIEEKKKEVDTHGTGEVESGSRA